MVKKALMVVAQNGFHPIEYGDTREELEKAGIEVKVASFTAAEAIGKDGIKIDVDVAINDVDVSDYDAVVFVGGHGARLEFLGNQDVIKLAQDFDNSEKVVAAICIAPRMLAEARILKDRKATVHNGDNESAEILGSLGSTYVEQDVVVDERVVTASGPHAAKDFGKAVAELLR